MVLSIEMELVPDHESYCDDDDVLASLNREGKVVQMMTKYYDMNHDAGLSLLYDAA